MRHLAAKRALSCCLYRRNVSNQINIPERSLRTEPLHRKLYNLTLREEKEEKLRDFIPTKPPLPSGWNLLHEVGSNRFELEKEIQIRGCGVELMHIIALMEIKQYEHTYRMDSGEREEQEYLNFRLFLKKKRYPKGGLEVGLTSIDMELVMDSLTIHDCAESFDNAFAALGLSGDGSAGRVESNLSLRQKRDGKYRGPMLSELDDDLSDEILDYLDERGINNAFAEFIMSQSHYFEQEEYLNWLHLLRRFAE